MKYHYPKSFPNEQEAQFLDLLLCDDTLFLEKWEAWKLQHVFDQTDYATSRLMPLLYLRLQSLGVHDALIGRIKGIYREVWVRNQLLIDATAKVVALLRTQHIPVIACKGIPLLLLVYRDVGARFLGDADILIPADQASQALDIVRNAGFTFIDVPFPVTDKDPKAAILAYDKEVTIRNAQQVDVDVHWRLHDEPTPMLSYQDVSPHALPVMIGKEQALSLSNEDQLLYVIVHGATYNFHRPIRWVVDAAMIIRNVSIDWQLLLHLVRTYHAEVAAYIAFHYLDEMKYAAVPPDVLQTLDAMPKSKSSIRHYYKQSDKPSMKFWGTLPLITKVYWNYEGKSLRGYIRYLGRAYNIRTLRELWRFVYDKCKKRILN